MWSYTVREKERKGAMLGIHLVWKQMIPCFLASAPEMRRSVFEGQASTSVSLCDREITVRWQKASATSITCTVLPAILRSLKAILRRFRKGNFSLPQWSEGFFSKTFVKDIYFWCDSWHNVAPIYSSFLPRLLLLSHLLFILHLSLFSFALFVCLLFAACMKEQQQQRIVKLNLSLLIRGDAVEFAGEKGTRVRSGICSNSWIRHISCHFLTYYWNFLPLPHHALLSQITWNDIRPLDVQRKLSFKMTLLDTWRYEF